MSSVESVIFLVWFVISACLGLAYFIDLGRASRSVLPGKSWILLTPFWPLLPSIFDDLDQRVRQRAIAYIVVSVLLLVAWHLIGASRDPIVVC